MYVGMNNYQDYDPKYCDGHYCPRDCERCAYRAENREEDEEQSTMTS